MKRALVYIGGSGRSGSTMLDILLNNSRHIQALGEVHRLVLYARRGELCGCGVPVSRCQFWNRVANEVRTISPQRFANPLLELDPMLRPEDVGALSSHIERASIILLPPGVSRSFGRLVWPKHVAAIQNSMLWYEGIRRATGSAVILDSTKDPRRLASLYAADPQAFRLIYLVRDGRAVSASAMRREGVGMDVAARRWLSANRRSRLAARLVPQRQRLFVRYEDLCIEPEGTMRSVCAFIGIPFEPNMLTLRKEEAHTVGGNPMRFRRDEQKIVLDEQWRGQLTASDLGVFDRVAGRHNRGLGYE